MGLFDRKAARAELPPAVRAALELVKGERVLAFGVDDNTGGYVIATSYGLAVVSLGAAAPTAGPATASAPTAAVPTAALTLRRRWLAVDAGAWEPETETLTVTWAEGGRGAQWSFRDQQTLLPETLRERVQASVVIATRLTLGDRRSGRVAIRQDFATRELIPQTILGRYTRADDPEVQAHVQAALAHLRDQVGLPA
jgi:hypothetical protein